MAAIAGTYGIAGGAVLALVAGADLLCLGGEDAGERMLDEVRDAIVAAVQRRRLWTSTGCRDAATQGARRWPSRPRGPADRTTVTDAADPRWPLPRCRSPDRCPPPSAPDPGAALRRGRPISPSATIPWGLAAAADDARLPRRSPVRSRTIRCRLTTSSAAGTVARAHPGPPSASLDDRCWPTAFGALPAVCGADRDGQRRHRRRRWPRPSPVTGRALANAASGAGGARRWRTDRSQS